MTLSIHPEARISPMADIEDSTRGTLIQIGAGSVVDSFVKFKPAGGAGDVLIGEVSTVNDDLTDNIFAAPIGRFARIDEDVAPTHLLVSDYDSDVG